MLRHAAAQATAQAAACAAAIALLLIYLKKRGALGGALQEDPDSQRKLA